jgi:DHA1 family tetracycline resistance protein-like MFS transporter
MTRRVSPTEQGQLQGALSSVSGITGMIAPGIYTFVFARSIGAWSGLGLPGAAFLVASSMLVGAIVVSVRAAKTARGAVEASPS